MTKFVEALWRSLFYSSALLTGFFTLVRAFDSVSCAVLFCAVLHCAVLSLCHPLTCMRLLVCHAILYYICYAILYYAILRSAVVPCDDAVDAVEWWRALQLLQSLALRAHKQWHTGLLHAGVRCVRRKLTP